MIGTAASSDTAPSDISGMQDNVRHGILEEAILRTTESSFEYTERDCILYALSIGSTVQDLDLVYERSPDFHAFPTLGVLTAFVPGARPALEDVLPNFNPVSLCKLGCASACCCHFMCLL